MSMTDQPAAQFADEAEQEQPEPRPEPAIIDLKPEPQEGPRALTKAAEMVPVKQHGAAPDNFMHQITLAQYMAKAQLMVPQHFHGNVGDCLAIIDISQRAGLSPYMVAAKTYKDPKGKGIAFESQLYHAFLIGSGWLKDAALHVKYDGEAEDRTCTVWGTLKGEDEPRYYTSPKLKDLLPAKNEYGAYKGSPLWGDKPDVQQFYDTTRDWGRMFCPIATLGMLAQYETIEHPISGTVEPPTDGGLKERLKNAPKTEGHQNGHADRELNNIASDAATTLKPAKTTQDAPGEAKPAETKRKPGRPKKAAFDDPPRTTTLAKPKETVSRAEAGRVADRAQALGDARARERAEKQKTDTPEPVPSTLKDCKTAADYQVYAMAWIDQSGDPEQALERWESERDARDDLTVRTPTRNALRSRLESKHGV